MSKTSSFFVLKPGQPKVQILNASNPSKNDVSRRCPSTRAQIPYSTHTTVLPLVISRPLFVNEDWRLAWLGHVLRQPLESLPRSALEFQGVPDWRRPPGSRKTMWTTVAQANLKPMLKPQMMSAKSWSTKWLELASDTAANRLQWRAIVRDSTEAGNGLQVSSKPYK